MIEFKKMIDLKTTQLLTHKQTHTQTKMEQVIRYNNFDASKVSFTEMKVNRYGGKTVGIKYNGKRFVIQTPKMYLPYGLSEYQVTDTNGNNTGDVKYSLDLSFKGWNSENKTATKTFYQCMNGLDNTLVQQGVENRVAWFKSKTHTTEVVKALYSTTVRRSKDRETGEVTDKWPPTMKAKLYRKDDGSFKCETYNSKRENVDFESSVTKGCYVQALLGCTGVWFAGGKFGLSWNVQQMIVHPARRITGFSFLDDEDDSEDVTVTETTVSSNALQFIEDEDEDEDDDNENGENEGDVTVEETADVDDEEEEIVEEVVEEVVEEMVAAIEEKKTKKKKKTAAAPKKKKTVRKSKKSQEKEEQVSAASAM